MKLLIIILMASTICSGCSLVQWLPSSSCEYVKYERVQNQVHAEVDCTL